MEVQEEGLLFQRCSVLLATTGVVVVKLYCFAHLCLLYNCK
jgi:hypothetical protein